MKKQYYLIILFILLNTLLPKTVLVFPRDILTSITKINKEINNNIDNLIQDENIELNKEINILKKQLELNNIVVDKKIINTTIISRNLTKWDNYLTVDKGSLNDIRDNMAVIAKDHLIGLTYNTGLYSSQVKLLTSNNIDNISVKIDGKELFGVLKRINNESIIEGITEDVEPNSIVLTSGLNDIPAGIKIGRVINIQETDNGLSRLIKVELYQDINTNYLMVVKQK